MRVLLAVALLAHLLSAQSVNAEVLDPEDTVNDQLYALSAALHEEGIDIAFNLNNREISRQVPNRPRIGMLVDIPSLRMPQSEELETWEQAYGAKQLGALAFITDQTQQKGLQPFSAFYTLWLESATQDRVMLSYAPEDKDAVIKALAVVSAQYPVLHLDLYGSDINAAISSADIEEGGRLFATVGQRWVMDTASARDIDAQLPEFVYLGKSMRRGIDSVVNPKSRAIRRLASGEPAVFLKQGLGDEFEASTIPEIIVPGGIALGEKPVFVSKVEELRFEQGRLWLVGANGRKMLPEAELATWKGSSDFAARAQWIGSDAIVDIDERGRVRISSALEDTELGMRMVRIDSEPFNYVTRLDVRKSVIIDNEVRFQETQNGAEFQVQYEVRFLQSDRMRIARTEAAIVYRYRSLEDSVMHIDSWGPSAFRLEQRTDFQGLGDSTLEVARYAAWIALFRQVHSHQLEFTQGRYEFLKIDNSGRSTPSRI